MAESRYPHPLIDRYASEEMAAIFSPRTQALVWRDLWIALAEEERALGVEIPDEAIAAKVRSERAKNPKVQAVIAADKGVVYDKVISTIDLVKQNGVTSFALNVERAAKKK